MSTSSHRKVAIIGSGIAGLCAGVYARRSGLDAEIFEAAHGPGGLAMSWKRHDYTFETCLHWLLGSKPGSPFHELWKEVFDIDELQFVDFDDFIRMETEDGRTLTVPRNVDRLERELLELAPEDAVPIRRLAKGIRRLRDLEMPLPSSGPLKYGMQLLKAVPHLSEMHYWSRMSAEEFGHRFRNPLLRAFFGEGGQAHMSAVALVFSLAWMDRKDAQYPVGGSQAVIRAIERRFLDLGGKIHYGCKVDRILVEDGTAKGLHLSDGGVVLADWVVSAADGHSTLFDWIPREYLDERVSAPYRE
ncbi:MAG TPA: NAD(P)/FAD-dependent oxidoreductase, partial [Bdellovibrionota bacterium]|nr:NAD(P)/FAD-dependent oxidoreductase [Bdellovibrionota bacterium]